MRVCSSTTWILAAAVAGAGAEPEGERRGAAQPSYTISINQFSPYMAGYQWIDGFGVSLAFQRANLITNMANKTAQRELLDLLFNQTIGAGFSILHNVIGSAPDREFDHMNSIEPNDPGGPDAAPQYVWDGKDSGQLWVSQQAVNLYGVSTIYANAFSAPGYMKTNHLDTSGGYLCGSLGATSCSHSDDWRRAYADYLVAYTRFYAAAGVNITHLGPFNEPDDPRPDTLHPSMQATPSQAADLASILQTALNAAGLAGQVGIACCDAHTWSESWDVPGLKAVTSHGMPPAMPSPHAPLWLTAQRDPLADDDAQWTSAWYETGAPSEGLSWANRIFDAVVSGNASAVLHWAGIGIGGNNLKNPNGHGDGQREAGDAPANALIRVLDPHTGQYQISPRLYAFVHWARYLRPGALQRGVSVSSDNGNGTDDSTDGMPLLRAAAFQNWGGPDRNQRGPLAVVVVNNGPVAASVQLQLVGSGMFVAAAEAVVTDVERRCAVLEGVVPDEGTRTKISGLVPARSVTTFLLTTFIYF